MTTSADATRWMHQLEQASDPAAVVPQLPECLRIAADGLAIARCHVEVIRFRQRSTKCMTVLRVDRMPELDTLAGFERKGAGDAISFRREREDVFIIREAHGVELTWSLMVDEISAELAYEQLCTLDAWRPMAALARPGAFLRTWGIGRDRTLGRLGLLTVDRDTERLTADETALGVAGFAPRGSDDDDAIWTLRDRSRSIVWMGGTVYGYVGPISESIGGWP